MEGRLGDIVPGPRGGGGSRGTRAEMLRSWAARLATRGNGVLAGMRAHVAAMSSRRPLAVVAVPTAVALVAVGVALAFALGDTRGNAVGQPSCAITASSCGHQKVSVEQQAGPPDTPRAEKYAAGQSAEPSSTGTSRSSSAAGSVPPSTVVPIRITSTPSAPAPELTPSVRPALPMDAPDPTAVASGNEYYLFTTGTVWGNRIAVAVCPTLSSCPENGWQTATGQPTGSTALPILPSWEKEGTQTSPSVAQVGGRWVMYYDAVDATDGHYCISVATASSPQGPYADPSSSPLICQTQYGGSIDPQIFQDSSGQLWLYWKTNDGSSTQGAYIWGAQLSLDGLQINGMPQVVFFQDTVSYPWEKTVENPDMFLANGHYYLFFSGGLWDSSGYAMGYAVCAGPSGPCVQPSPSPILSSGQGVFGPGGGMVFTGADGRTWLVYAAWNNQCTSYSCGGARDLFITPITFP